VTVERPPLPDSYEGLLNRAQFSFRSGDVEEAIALYRRLVDKLGRLSDRILTRRPELRDLHLQARQELAGLLRLEGRYAEAIEVKRVLLESHPDQADRWRRELAVLRLSQGNVEAGLSELRTLAEEEPEDARRWLVLGSETLIEGRFAESQAALDRALEAAGGDQQGLAEVHYQRFRLYKAMRRLDDAMTAWEAAVACDPQVSTTVREVYTMLTEAGRYSEAQRYIARDDNPLQAGLQRGLIAYLTGSAAQARREWREVAGLDPDEYQVGHDAWVEAVLRLGDPDPALEWLQDALAERGTPRLLILSGIGWAMRQDRELATVLFQQAINVLRRGRPAKQKLDSADWRLLDSLVTDTELKTALKPYFAIVETVWG
jgi:tetratricopeptide (TPR) repeat protein